MKKTNFLTKLFAVILCAVLFISIGTLGALAASEDNGAQDERTAVIEDTAKGVEDESGNVFEGLYRIVADYISEILCILAFAGSFLIAVLYKKGLVPLLKSALSGLSTAVGRIKDATENAATIQAASSEQVGEALNRAYDLIEGQRRIIEAVEKRLDELSENESERKRMRIILEEEVELLYDIFMSSSLPEYQKEAVAKRLKVIASGIKKDGEEA